MASRSEEKISVALDKLRNEELRNERFSPLDLADPRKAKLAAEKFLKLENRLDILS